MLHKSVFLMNFNQYLFRKLNFIFIFPPKISLTKCHFSPPKPRGQFSHTAFPERPEYG